MIFLLSPRPGVQHQSGLASAGAQSSARPRTCASAWKTDGHMRWSAAVRGLILWPSPATQRPLI